MRLASQIILTLSLSKERYSPHEIEKSMQYNPPDDNSNTVSTFDSSLIIFLDLVKSNHRSCSIKKAVHRKTIFTGKHRCIRILRIFKNAYFEEHMQAATFVWCMRIKKTLMTQSKKFEIIFFPLKLKKTPWWTRLRRTIEPWINYCITYTFLENLCQWVLINKTMVKSRLGIFFTQYLQIHDGIVKIRGNNFNVTKYFACKPQIYIYKTMIKPLNMMKNNKVRNKIMAISRLYSETFYFMRYTLKIL